MSSAEASTSQRPATNVVGTSMPRSDTRRCFDVVTARCMYQSIGVVRNSLIARAASSGSGTGSMKPLWLSTAVVRRPTGSRRVTRVAGLPRIPMTRARLTVIAERTNRGTPRGASMEAKVPPGTPATANSPVTRSGCR